MFITMHLQNEPFEKIKNGTKTIEMQLFDGKLRFLTRGDTIEFINLQSNEKMECEVIGVHIYSTFEELYNNYTKQELGYGDDENASPKDMEKYYPIEEQLKNAVVGIEIKRN